MKELKKVTNLEKWSDKKLDRILQKLPPKEADLLELYYVRKFKQVDLASLFGMSQPTVHYRIRRALRRLDFLKDFHGFSDRKIHNCLTPYVEDELTLNVLKHFLKISCQLQVAKKFNMSQGKVRYKILCTLELLKKGGSELYPPFQRLFENSGILRHYIKSPYNIQKDVLEVDSNIPSKRPSPPSKVASGDEVKILEGYLTSLEGHVVKTRGNIATVIVQLRSVLVKTKCPKYALAIL